MAREERRRRTSGDALRGRGAAAETLRHDARGGARERRAIGGRLGELRLDTDLDISHGVVRYLELLKLAALLQRPEGRDVAEALADINARLLAATTPLQREIFQTSRSTSAARRVGATTRSRRAVRARGRCALAQAIAPREASSLGPFLPRKGIGLALSASDIETYRGCPLRYKFARVLRIPTEQTLNQRFGIVVHQVLERYHSELRRRRSRSCSSCSTQSWRRSGFGDDDEHERELYGRRAPRSRATTSACTARTPSRCGSSARSPSGSGPTTCAGASTASTGSGAPTARSTS